MKKLSAKSLRQGQTVYLVDHGLKMIPAKPEIIKFHIYSDATPLPPEGCIIDKMPCWLLKRHFERSGTTGYYYSRRKAERELKRLKHEYSLKGW